jgi:2-iminobutanoate/2-iminopropanoate deaminase
MVPHPGEICTRIERCARPETTLATAGRATARERTTVANPRVRTRPSEGSDMSTIGRWGATALIITALASACSDSSDSTNTSDATTTAPERELVEPGVMLSQAAVHGDLVWTAGHLPEGVPVDAPIEDQVNQVLDNLEATLTSAGAGFDTLLKTNVYLLDWDDWEAFNEIYEARIGVPYTAPPRTTVDVEQLGLGYRIEIEMVAHVRAP